MGLPTTSAHRYLQNLFSLDASSPDFSHQLYRSILDDEGEEYSAKLSMLELIQLMGVFDGVRTVPSAFHQFMKQTHRPSVSSPQLIVLHKHVYRNSKPFAVA